VSVSTQERYKQRILERVQSLPTNETQYLLLVGIVFSFLLHRHPFESETHCPLKNSTSLQCSICQQADNALHILSGCQHNTISEIPESGMITERYDIACRFIMKVIS